MQLGGAALRLLRTLTEGLGDRRPKTLFDEAVKARCRLPDIDYAQVPVDLRGAVGEQPVRPVGGEVQSLANAVVCPSGGDCRATSWLLRVRLPRRDHAQLVAVTGERADPRWRRRIEVEPPALADRAAPQLHRRGSPDVRARHQPGGRPQHHWRVGSVIAPQRVRADPLCVPSAPPPPVAVALALRATSSWHHAAIAGCRGRQRPALDAAASLPAGEA